MRRNKRHSEKCIINYYTHKRLINYYTHISNNGYNILKKIRRQTYSAKLRFRFKRNVRDSCKWKSVQGAR